MLLVYVFTTLCYTPTVISKYTSNYKISIFPYTEVFYISLSYKMAF
jgi:hypothetical protein